MLRDIRYAFRSFRRSPLATATIVTTVALGLGLVAAVFTILNALVFRVDAVRNPRELFAVERPQAGGEAAGGFTRDDYEDLVRETTVFSEAFATTGDVQAWFDGSRREGALVTANFFQVLGAGAARGRTLTPSDDEPGRLPVVVLSQRAWVQHFAADPGVVGRTVRVNGISVDIVGVMPDGFRGLEPLAAPDFWAPLSLADQFRRGERAQAADGDLRIVGRLSPGSSRGAARAQLLAWDARRAEARGVGGPVASGVERPAVPLALEPRPGTLPLTADVLVLFTPLFFAFGLILLIGCANVANLLLARGVARQREIGVRLAIGASRGRIVSQLLIEGLLLSLVSAALAFAISRLVLTTVVHAVITSFPPSLGNLRIVVPAADWRVALFLMAGAMASTVLFALAPALQATRIEPVRAMRGEVVRDARPGRARNALLALQVTGSALLLICAAVFLRSAWVSAAGDPGIRTANVVTVSVLNEQRRGTILDELATEPLVTAVAASWPGLLGGRPALAEADTAGGGRQNGASGRLAITYQRVSPEYFGVLDIHMVRGREFGSAEADASAAVAIVSERVARAIWPDADAVGRVLRLDPDVTASADQPDDLPLTNRAAVVVGVAQDVPGIRLGGFRMAGADVYLPIRAAAPGASLTVRVRIQAEAARRAIVDRLAAIDPNMADVATLETFAGAEAYLLAIPFWLTMALGALALLLTLSGLFGVLSYLVAQRTREIGVRMALGATRGGIAALVLMQSARPVAIGLLVGGGLTAGLGAILLATPAAAQIGGAVRLFDPVAYGGSLLCIVAACAAAALVPALRAGRVDPVDALRRD